MARIPRLAPVIRRSAAVAKRGFAEAGLSDGGGGAETDVLLKAAIVAATVNRLRTLAASRDARDLEEMRKLTQLSRAAAGGDEDADALLRRLRSVSPHAAEQIKRTERRRPPP